MEALVTPVDRSVIFRYLLDQLPEAEQDEVERRYFGEDSCWEEVQAAEDDLIDLYVRGQLAAADRIPFERLFVHGSPRRRERVAFSQALWRLTREQAPARTPWWRVAWDGLWGPRLALAGAFALLVVLTTFALSWRQQLGQANTERARLEQQNRELRDGLRQPTVESPPQVAEAKPPTPPVPVPTFDLQPVLVRGSTGVAPLRVPTQAAEVVFRLALESPASGALIAVLETPEGAIVWRGRGVRARGTTATLRVPARVLASDDYLLRLTSGGDEPVAEYSFRIRRD